MKRSARSGERFPLLPRPRRADKTAYGHALIIAGSAAMPGAAALAAKSALVSGAGLVTLALPGNLAPQSKLFPPEAMRLWIGPSAESKIERYIKERRVSVCAVGPGLSLAPNVQRLVRTLVRRLELPLVLDADGLNALKGRASLLKTRQAASVLTPHAKEFSRLFGESVPTDVAGRADLAKKVARLYHGVLVLKGATTVVASKDRASIEQAGNPGLAKGGSGDVLTGIITAFIAQGLPPYEAARWAVRMHGRAADLAVRQTSELGLTATRLIDFLPKAFLRS